MRKKLPFGIFPKGFFILLLFRKGDRIYLFHQAGRRYVLDGDRHIAAPFLKTGESGCIIPSIVEDDFRSVKRFLGASAQTLCDDLVKRK